MGANITIETLKDLAISRGGKCLSSEYINSQTPLEWECEKGHKWFAKPAKVKFGTWCKVCAGSNKKSLEEMEKLAVRYNSICLSKTYLNNHSPLKWKCDKGHVFNASYSGIMRAIKNKGFCTVCSVKKRGENKRNTIEEMQELAKSRGGICLSATYTDAHTSLIWQCANGHVFESKANTVKNGHWCRSCRFNLTENKCRYIIENLTGLSFKPNKRELDGYNSKIKTAFEYNGIQHYEYVEFFHRTQQEFKRRIETDVHKLNLCKEKGINLIIIPYTITTDSDLIQFIHKKLVSFKVDEITQPENINMGPFYSSSTKLNELSELAIKNGGKLLSNHYHNNKTKLTWMCQHGHEWDARPNDIKSGQWCSVCNGSHPLSIEEMRQIANERGGMCLSTTYINSKEHLEWECSKGHRWFASPSGIKGGNWCIKCRKKEAAAKRKLTIEEMNKIAHSRAGQCLSDQYINSQTHLLWQCSEGHIWKAKPNNIKHGTWCPRCKNRKI
ncbi:hypothetical protein [Cytobacillus praedii]|uniref:zinc-ribbon domain-containing protein n=1 Tax=Cytobacillus praedii TaxID=1742358 RepID=UPI002E1DD1BF|nr:hypothetical protein [Cytobacillus praedii]